MTIIDLEELANLIKEFKQGNKKTFRAIYDMTWRHVYFTLVKRVGDSEEIKDLMQEVYLKIYKSVHKLENEKVFLAWVDKLIVNKCIDTRRKKDNLKTGVEYENIIESMVEDDKDFLPEESFIKNEEHLELYELINALPKEQRDLIKMFYFQDKSASEISLIIGVSENAVCKRLFDARKKMKKLSDKLSQKYKNNNGFLSISLSPILFSILCEEFFESSNISLELGSELFEKIINTPNSGMEFDIFQNQQLKSLQYKISPIQNAMISKTAAIIFSVAILGVSITSYIYGSFSHEKALTSAELNNNKISTQIELPKEKQLKTEQLKIINPIVKSQLDNNNKKQKIVPKSIHLQDSKLIDDTEKIKPSEVSHAQVSNIKSEIKTTQKPEIIPELPVVILSSESIESSTAKSTSQAVNEINVKIENSPQIPLDILQSEKTNIQNETVMKKSIKKYYSTTQNLTKQEFIEDVWFSLGNSFDLSFAEVNNYEALVNFNQIGVYNVLLTSKIKNSNQVSEKLEVVIEVSVEIFINDEIAPTVSIKNKVIEVSLGNVLSEDNIIQKANIYIADNIDRNIIPNFADLESVNYDKVGEYIVIINAKDLSENQSENYTIVISVVENK